MIPEDLKIRASKYANAVGISLGEFIRESLEKALKSNPAGSIDDPLLNDNAVFGGDTPVDLALDHDKYLYEDLLRFILIRAHSWPAISQRITITVKQILSGIRLKKREKLVQPVILYWMKHSHCWVVMPDMALQLKGHEISTLLNR